METSLELTHSDLGLLSRRKVLVVEDEPDMRLLVSFVLQQAGYDVSEAADGLEAIRKYDEESPDLVVLDLGLPKVSGFRLLHLFKHGSDPSPAKVVVLTALDFQEAEEIVLGGADDFLSKPFDPLELLRKLEFALAEQPHTAR